MISFITIKGIVVKPETVSTIKSRNLELEALTIEEYFELDESSKAEIKSIIESGELVDIEVIYVDGCVLRFMSGVVLTGISCGLTLRPFGMIEFTQDS